MLDLIATWGECEIGREKRREKERRGRGIEERGREGREGRRGREKRRERERREGRREENGEEKRRE
jgi:hypothetical protein